MTLAPAGRSASRAAADCTSRFVSASGLVSTSWASSTIRKIIRRRPPRDSSRNLASESILSLAPQRGLVHPRASPLQPQAHFRPWRDPAALRKLFPALKHHKVRDRPNLIQIRQFRVRLRVHLEDQSPPRHLLRQQLDLGRRRKAWSAPGSPEVHQNRNLRILNDRQEIAAVRFDRLVRRSERRFTGSAASCIRQVLRRNAIGRAAGSAEGEILESHGLWQLSHSLNVGCTLPVVFRSTENV